jgi:hypothetical protein
VGLGGRLARVPTDDEKFLEANNYLLFAQPNTEVVYFTKTSEGPPSLRVEGPLGEHTYSGDEIRTSTGELGTEVSVTLVAGPGADPKSLTAVLPPVRVPASNPDVEFDTLMIVTTKKPSSPDPPPGPEYSYEVLPTFAHARVVEF